jgi:hypothetical protein
MMDRALRRVYELLPSPDREYCATAFGQFAGVKNSACKLKLIEEATDSEQMNDYLAEVRYALIFRWLNFGVEAEPMGDDKVGPDFRVSRDGHEAYLEVRRFRPMGEGPTLVSHPSTISGPDCLLDEYGNPEKEIRKGFAAITEKFRQLREGDSILAFWNSDEDLDELSFEDAVRSFIDHPEIHPVPSGLSFVVFGSAWHRPRSGQQLYCLPVRSLKPHEETWRAELEALQRSPAAVALQRDSPGF